MCRIRTAIFLSLILGPLSPALGQAEVWRCTQPGGSVLFTNIQKDLATCQKYESGTELGYIYVSKEAPPPAPDTAPPVREPPYQTEPRPQAPEPYPPPGYDQESYPYYYYPYYYDYPGVYWLFIRPRFFPSHRHSPRRFAPVPFQPSFRSVPRSGFHHGGGHRGGGHHR